MENKDTTIRLPLHQIRSSLSLLIHIGVIILSIISLMVIGMMIQPQVILITLLITIIILEILNLNFKISNQKRDRNYNLSELKPFIDEFPSPVIIRGNDEGLPMVNIHYTHFDNDIDGVRLKGCQYPSISEALSVLEQEVIRLDGSVSNQMEVMRGGVKYWYSVNTGLITRIKSNEITKASFFTDISAFQRLIDELEEQHRFFWHIGEISSLLFQTGDPESRILKTISWMGEMIGADRVFFLENATIPGEGTPVMRKRYQWERDIGRTPCSRIISGPETSISPYVDWLSDLSSGKVVSGKTSQLSGKKHTSLFNSGVLSFLLVPVRTNSEFLGFIGFETITHERVWTSSDTPLLTTLAASIGLFLQQIRTQDALRWNEALLSAMAGASPQGLFVVDNDTDDILYANEQFCSIWNLTEYCEEIKNQKLKNNDIIPYCIPLLADPQAFAESCTPLQDKENRICIDDEIKFIDGRTIRRHSTQIRGKKDEYFGRFYIFQDITQIKKVEESIRESEERFRAIFDYQQAMLIIDADTHHIVNVNHEAMDLIGASRDEIIGSLCHQFVCPALKGQCPLSDLGQQVDHSERVLITKAKERVPVIKSVYPITIHGKKYFIESFTDISEQKRQEENLTLINETLINLGSDPFENIRELTTLAGLLLHADFALYGRPDPDHIPPTATWNLPPDFELSIQSAGNLMHDLLNIGSDEIILKSDLNQVDSSLCDPISIRYTINSCIGKAIRKGRDYSGILALFYHSKVSLRASDEKLLSVISAAIGMAEDRRKALDQLNDFAYVISHDLKAPLRGIHSLAEWMLEDYQDTIDEAGRKNLNLMLERVKRMQRLIDGVLSYSRIGRTVEIPEAISLKSLLEEVVETLSLPDSFTLSIPQSMPTLVSDRIRITQIFENLISNAIKYVDRRDGNITILVEKEGEYYRFGVRDNGPGIDPRYHEQVFQIFQTFHKREGVDSTGIGLTIVRKIVENLGGRIWVESEVGKGATFYFTLPAGNDEKNE